MKVKQIVDAITKLLFLDGSNSMAADLNFGGFKGVNAAPGVSSNDLVTVAQLGAALNNRSIKDPARAISTANIALTGLQTIDGVVLVAGDRVLVAGQTLGQNNGIYLAAAGAWSRALDLDTDAETIAGFIISIQEGTLNADTVYELTTNAPITLGTTVLSFQREDGIRSGTIAKGNKNMTASVTTADGQLATVTTLAEAPNKGGAVEMFINGHWYECGDGVKTKPFYLSSDAGATAKTFANATAGDSFYFNGSLTDAVFQLEATDKITAVLVVLK